MLWELDLRQKCEMTSLILSSSCCYHLLLGIPSSFLTCLPRGFPSLVLSRCWGSPAPRPRTIHVLHVHPVSSSFQFWLCPLLPKIIPSSRRMGDKKLFGCGLTESLKSWVPIWYLDKVCSHQDPLARLRKQRYTGKL